MRCGEYGPTSVLGDIERRLAAAYIRASTNRKYGNLQRCKCCQAAENARSPCSVTSSYFTTNAILLTFNVHLHLSVVRDGIVKAIVANCSVGRITNASEAKWNTNGWHRMIVPWAPIDMQNKFAVNNAVVHVYFIYWYWCETVVTDKCKCTF